MTRTITLSLTAVVAVLAIGTDAAQARGGGDDIAEQREALRSQLAEERAQAGGLDDCATASLWEMMFGHDEATTEAAPSKTGS